MNKMGKKHLGDRDNFMLRIPVAINDWLSQIKGKPSKNAKITDILYDAMEADLKKKKRKKDCAKLLDSRR